MKQNPSCSGRWETTNYQSFVNSLSQTSANIFDLRNQEEVKMTDYNETNLFRLSFYDIKYDKENIFLRK